jgi:molybdopterin/thiamine biosynthesis adenylyltransferase/rhodanese-related sulfurtransferase
VACRDESRRVTDRYARQTAVPEVGSKGQARIRAARVLVIGAGGLGCAVLQYLCAAGVGQLVIVDPDRVEEANLHRQPLYRMSDLGRSKVEAARETLHALNPDVDLRVVCERLTPANAPALIASADIVVDAADSFAVTYTLSDECTRASKPLVSVSVLGLSGYVGVFCAAPADGSGECRRAPSYRAVFPDLPAHAGSCATAGVLGTAVGVMGTMQAHLVLSLLLGIQPASAVARLLTFDFRTLRIGGFSFAAAREPEEPMLRFIAPSEVMPADLTVDLRSSAEAPTPAFPSSLRMQGEDVEQLAGGTAASRRIVLCCRSGVRAWRAAARLRSQGMTNLALIALGD